MSHNYDDLRCYSCDQFCCDCELCKCCRTAITHHGHIATVIAAKEAEIERLRAVVDAMLDRPFRGSSDERRYRMYGSDWEAVHDALDAIEEARRD